MADMRFCSYSIHSLYLLSAAICLLNFDLERIIGNGLSGKYDSEGCRPRQYPVIYHEDLESKDTQPARFSPWLHLKKDNERVMERSSHIPIGRVNVFAKTIRENLLISSTQQEVLNNMQSGVDLLCSVLKIVHIVNAILDQAQVSRDVEEMLKDAELKARNIETRTRKTDLFYAFEGQQAEILEDAVRDFKKIFEELVIIRGKLENKSVARQFLNATEIVAQLNDICRKLTPRNDNLKLVTLIGALNIELRTYCAGISGLLQQLNSKNLDTASMEAQLKHIRQLKMVEDCAREFNLRRKGYRTDQIIAHVHFCYGLYLYEGSYGTKCYEIAAQHFHAAIKLGWSRAYYYIGMLYKNGEGVDVCNISAKKYFQLGTNAEDPAAITQLGVCYDEGIGVERSPEKSASLLKLGAEAGDLYGMGYYAWCKMNGHNTDVNLPLVFRMASKASKRNYALETLGLCYAKGIQVERDPKEAVRLFLKVVELGEGFTPRLSLARCFEKGIGVDTDLEKAASLYEEGTKLLVWQRPYFQGYYGLCLIRGSGVPQDIEKGWAEVRKSIQGRNANGWFVKGECYRHGYGVKPDLALAVVCYRRASQMKNGADGKIAANYALGSMFEIGQGGLERNMTRAFEHYSYAADRMHQTAQWKIGVFCESGTGVDRFEQRAVHYFRLAANSGHNEALIKARKYYMKGKGVSRDLHSAVQILRPAAESGNKEAKRLFRRLQIQLLFRRESSSPVQSEPTIIGTCKLLLQD